jgi:predicted kinase
VSGAGEPPVLILSGAPGVGKTTAAAALADLYPRSVHLESDRFFAFIRSGHVAPWNSKSAEQNRTVMQIVAEAAGRYAAAGYLTLVDGIVIPGWYFEPTRDALREAGHEVAYAVLRAPLPVCIERVREREGGSLFDAEAMDRLWSSFAGLGALEANVIEVEGMEAEDIAAELRDRLVSGSLGI